MRKHFCDICGNECYEMTSFDSEIGTVELCNDCKDKWPKANEELEKFVVKQRQELAVFAKNILKGKFSKFAPVKEIK